MDTQQKPSFLPKNPIVTYGACLSLAYVVAEVVRQPYRGPVVLLYHSAGAVIMLIAPLVLAAVVAIGVDVSQKDRKTAGLVFALVYTLLLASMFFYGDN